MRLVAHSGTYWGTPPADTPPGLHALFTEERRASTINQNDQSNDNKDDGDLKNKTAPVVAPSFRGETKRSVRGHPGAAGSMPRRCRPAILATQAELSPVARLLLGKSAKLRDLI